MHDPAKIRGPDEAKIALELQVKALNSSCKCFDEGERWEALRIATAVHTIVHDAGKSNKSVLTHADMKTGMRFLASARPINPKNRLTSTPLCFVRIGLDIGGQILPLLNEEPSGHRWVAFSRWWQDEPIFSSGANRHLLSRRNLTFALRNQEGGGHWDARIFDKSYVEMSESNTTFFLAEGQAAKPIRGGELATMRQIGWELLETLKKAGVPQ